MIIQIIFRAVNVQKQAETVVCREIGIYRHHHICQYAIKTSIKSVHIKNKLPLETFLPCHRRDIQYSLVEIKLKDEGENVPSAGSFSLSKGISEISWVRSKGNETGCFQVY